jgi:LmbE family N-acetylglucosaminyl deacetylase
VNDHVRDRIMRRLDALSDERGYQVLDYVEFLDSKYAERQSPSANVFTKLTESVEDKLRAGRVSATVIAETMGFLNRASNVLNGAMAAGKSVASEFVNVVSQTGEPKKTDEPQAKPAVTEKAPDRTDGAA